VEEEKEVAGAVVESRREKSAEAVECKRVVKHSWFKERKERGKERS
jgi:hypothetical protein